MWPEAIFSVVVFFSVIVYDRMTFKEYDFPPHKAVRTGDIEGK